MQRYRIWVVMAAVALIGYHAWSRWIHKPARPVTADAIKTDKPVIPALGAPASAALALDVETERTSAPAGKALRFRLGAGKVVLTLYQGSEAEGEHGMAFGDAALVCLEREACGAVLAAVADWLEVKVPAAVTPPGELRPLRFAYVHLGDDGEWAANKLFLNDDAEVFLNVHRDGKRARLVEKDPDYRDEIVSMLAVALRDGQPARRTPATDPAFSSAAPLVAALRPVAGAAGRIGASTWLQKGWLAAEHRAEKSKLLLWDGLDQPPRLLAEVSGYVDSVLAAPGEDRVAAIVLHPKEAGSVSSDDTGDLAVISLDDGQLRTLASSAADFAFTILSRPVWSPDGEKLAVAGEAKQAGTPKAPGTIVRTYDVAGGRVVETMARPEALFVQGWDKRGVHLQETVYEGDTVTRHAWTWQPGGAFAPESAAHARWKAPADGRFSIAVREGGLDIRGPQGVQRFAPARESDKSAVGLLEEDDGIHWLGNDRLVLLSDGELALDLATRKLRYLLPDDGSRFDSASPDGHRVLARNVERKLVWGEPAE